MESCFQEPDTVEEAIMENEEVELRELRKKEKKALFTIYQEIDDTMFEIIAPPKTS